MDNTLASPQPKLAPAALRAGVPAFIGLGGYAVWMALHRHDPRFLLGLLPALGYLAACVALGLRVLPRWSTLTAGLLLLTGATAFTFCGLAFTYGWFSPLVLPHDFMVATLAGMLGCAFWAALFLGGGWVYHDAALRGLNAGMWATVTIVLFAYLLGFILYLLAVVVRDHRRMPCGNCGTHLAPTLAYCTRCGAQVHAVCAGCGARSLPGAGYCGVCGRSLAPAASA
jgi:hypothetical protein